MIMEVDFMAAGVAEDLERGIYGATKGGRFQMEGGLRGQEVTIRGGPRLSD